MRKKEKKKKKAKTKNEHITNKAIQVIQSDYTTG